MEGPEKKVVGRIAGLWRYPVKSMAAEPLTKVEVTWHGLAGDRRWAFVRDGTTSNGFPWLTLRQRADMSHYRPKFAEPAQPDRSPTLVMTPSGAALDVTDPALAAELADGARVLRQDRGVFDTFPLSVITTRTVARLGELVGCELDILRFRPNFLIDAEGEAEFPEDAWVGSTLHVGSLSFRIDKRDGRCIVITIDPETTERNDDVLRTVAKERDGCLGVYGSVVTPGHVAVGDTVFLEESG